MKLLAAVLATALATSACGGEQSSSGASAERSSGAHLTGAGSTFAYPLYSQWTADYAAQSGIKVNYQSIGSGGGIRQFSEQTVDFGATDSPMTDEELARAKGGAVLHVPTAMGAVVVTYNLPDVKQPVRLTSDVLVDIFLGKIKTWNAPQITALNPGVALPAQNILVVHRSDGSGTTFVFTDYLAAVSPEWARSPGRGKELQWPVGLGGKGNEGVAGQVRLTPGAIGYVELAFAKEVNLPTALIRNAAGNFVAPSIESVTAAAAAVAAGLPPTTDFRVSIVNAQGADAYPISSFTWILMYEQQADSAKGKQLVDFVRWGITEGQARGAALDYAPLPANMVTQLKARLDAIRLGSGGATAGATVAPVPAAGSP